MQQRLRCSANLGRRSANSAVMEGSKNQRGEGKDRTGHNLIALQRVRERLSRDDDQISVAVVAGMSQDPLDGRDGIGKRHAMQVEDELEVRK
eukprot:755388-Hanusia_phi.AAC.4